MHSLALRVFIVQCCACLRRKHAPTLPFNGITTLLENNMPHHPQAYFTYNFFATGAFLAKGARKKLGNPIFNL